MIQYHLSCRKSQLKTSDSYVNPKKKLKTSQITLGSKSTIAAANLVEITLGSPVNDLKITRFRVGLKVHSLGNDPPVAENGPSCRSS